LCSIFGCFWFTFTDTGEFFQKKKIAAWIVGWISILMIRTKTKKKWTQRLRKNIILLEDEWQLKKEQKNKRRKTQKNRNRDTKWYLMMTKGMMMKENCVSSWRLVEQKIHNWYFFLFKRNVIWTIILKRIFYLLSLLL
jgi:hypothetical protein